MNFKAKDFIKSVFKFSIATWVNFGISLLSTIITTRLLSPENYAVINIFNTATTTGLSLVCIGLDSGYIRFFYEPPAHDNQRNLLFKLLSVSLGNTCISWLVISVFWGQEFSKMLFDEISYLFIFMLFLNIVSTVIMRYLNITYRMNMDAKKYTIQNVIFQSLAKFWVIIGALLHQNINILISMSAVLLFIASCVYVLIQRKDIIPERISFNLKGYSGLFKYSVFAAPITIAVSCNTFFANIIIKSRLSLADTGLFASASSIALIINVLQGGFATYWSGFMFKNYKTAQSLCQKVHDIFMLGVMFLFIGLVFFKDILYILIGRDFQQSKVFFAFLLVSPVLSLALETTSYGINIAKKTHLSLIFYIIYICTNLASIVILIKPLGITGAAMASCMASVLLFVLSTIAGQYYYKTITHISKTVVILLQIVMYAFVDAYVVRTCFYYLFVLILIINTIYLYRKEIYSWIKILRNC